MQEALQLVDDLAFELTFLSPQAAISPPRPFEGRFGRGALEAANLNLTSRLTPAGGRRVHER